MKLKLKSVLIPPQILTLKTPKIKVAEKLLLSMYAADPKPMFVHRALSMTSAGIRKLKERLINKRLLTVNGGSHVIHVPGLVCGTHPEEGHFCSELENIETEQKVAVPASTDTRALNSITIPVEILKLKDVNPSDKCLLSLYLVNRTAQNEQVLAALGISRAGLTKAKGRLIKCGMLSHTDAGYQIHVPGLVFIGGHYIPEKEAIKSGQIVAPREIKSLEVLYDEWRMLIVKLSPAAPCVFEQVTFDFIRQIMDEVPESPRRKDILCFMLLRTYRYFAYQYAFDHLPRTLWKKCKNQIENATPDQLVTFREKAEASMLDGIPPKKLIAMFSGDLSQ